MTAQTKHTYLLLSRGQWHADLPAEDIQQAIEAFYLWYEDNLAQGNFGPGSRLSTEIRRVSSQGITDGPFTETKEVIGGYWFILANSLDEAARLAAQNPCMACGLEYEIRPLDATPANALVKSNETPE
ncbi:YciI family protein [Bowmanella denitrificans]|uniref:YciI family protein n=1 Tax=Bowmanella denitrificans TaxID=366582 RepID=UPI001C0ED7C7|nr:YciI family protein [Bowmanella denitrificans]